MAKERQKRVEMEKIHGKTIDSSQSVKKADSEHIKEIHINDLLKMSGRG